MPNSASPAAAIETVIVKHVVDQQRAARDDADARPQQLRGDQVAAAAAGKLFDDVAVAGRDDEHGEDRHQRQEDRQEGDVRLSVAKASGGP